MRVAAPNPTTGKTPEKRKIDMVRELTKGAAVATAVFALLSGGAAADEKKMEKPKEGAKVVQCGGINACKGQGACAGASNACKSHNACKGQGWVETKTEKECTDKGGKVVAMK
jgi:uncharacterized membrane protein